MAVPVAQLQEESGDELTRVPTAMEREADPEDLAMIRELFGSRANTLINCLLGFDAYFAWYYPLKKSLPFRCEMALREQRALDNTLRAIDMHEIMERITIRNHKSFLPHGAIYKVSRDILNPSTCVIPGFRRRVTRNIWRITTPQKCTSKSTKHIL